MVRTTVVFDQLTQQAIQQLATRWRCSRSAAIRRALVAQCDAVVGTPKARRVEKRRLLLQLCSLFEGTDASAEIKRRKAEDGYF